MGVRCCWCSDGTSSRRSTRLLRNQSGTLTGGNPLCVFLPRCCRRWAARYRRVVSRDRCTFWAKRSGSSFATSASAAAALSLSGLSTPLSPTGVLSGPEGGVEAAARARVVWNARMRGIDGYRRPLMKRAGARPVDARSADRITYIRASWAFPWWRRGCAWR